ncbi:MAG: metalloregulator ArsR/SmtB family transcription factor [Planctomycetota bacterium]|nr:metalloregulator ArsR/SmtB family transcription factor [Planctomycetota bacterium]
MSEWPKKSSKRPQRPSRRSDSSPARILILEALGSDSAHVGELVERLNLPQAVVSQHLRKLYMQKFVSRTREGNRILYSLARKEVLDIFGCLEKCLYRPTER